MAGPFREGPGRFYISESALRLTFRFRSSGHSDYQAMKPYIAIAEKTKADAMKLYDEELKK